MPVLPFSNHIGPGGGDPSGAPTNQVDELARHHDKQYETASDSYAIQGADSLFLEELALVNPKDPVEYIHKFAAKLGISAKRFIESHFGVIYPNMASEAMMGGPQVPRPSVIVGEPPNKKKKENENKSAMPAENPGNVDAGAVSLPNIPKNFLSGRHKHHFSKKFFLEIVTFDPSFLYKPDANKALGYWGAPIYSFSPGQLGWYMDQGEINIIKNYIGHNIKVSNITGDISVLTVNSPFITQTATSNQTSANTHVNLTLFKGSGLEMENFLTHGAATIGYNSTEGGYKMTAWTPGLFDTAKLNDFEFGTNPIVIPATFRPLPYNQTVGLPGAFTTPTAGNLDRNTLCPPAVLKDMKTHVASSDGGCFACWNYEPNYYIATQEPITKQLGSALVGIDTQPYTIIAEAASQVVSINAAAATAAQEFIVPATALSTTTTIFSNNSREHGRNGRIAVPSYIPQEYLGFLPPTTIGSAIQPIKITLAVNTTIELETSYDSRYSSNALCNGAQFKALKSFPSMDPGHIRNRTAQSTFNNLPGSYMGFPGTTLAP